MNGKVASLPISDLPKKRCGKGENNNDNGLFNKIHKGGSSPIEND